jgi:hypothetical protein
MSAQPGEVNSMRATKPTNGRRDAGLLTLVMAFCAFCGGCQQPTAPPVRGGEWADAETVWAPWAEEYLIGARQQAPRQHLEWVEYTTGSIRRFLPEHRIFVLTGYRIISHSVLFAVSRRGEIVDLGQGDRWINTAEGKARNSLLTGFVVSQKIVLAEPQDVVDCVRFIWDLSGAANLVTCSRINGVKCSEPGLFDGDELHAGWDPAYWKLTPRREASTWIITMSYVGPPAQTVLPPIYELTVDEGDRLVDVCLHTDLTSRLQATR